LYGCVYSLDGVEKISSLAEGELSDAEALGRNVANDLMRQGAKEFEAQWRQKYGPW